jgi:uncharacterized protein (TIGR03382 family)
MALDAAYKYYNPYTDRMRFHAGAVEGFSVKGGEEGGEGLQTPPAAGLLMWGGLGALFRRRKRA